MKTRGIIFTYSQVESLLEEGHLTDYQLLDDNGGDPYGNCVIVLERQFKENEIEELGLADELVDVWVFDNFNDGYAELDFEGKWYAKGCTNEAVFAEESDFDLIDEQ